MEFVLVLTTIILAGMMAALILIILNDRLFAIRRQRTSEAGPEQQLKKRNKRTFAVTRRWKRRMLRGVGSTRNARTGEKIFSSLFLAPESRRTDAVGGIREAMPELPSWHDDRLPSPNLEAAGHVSGVDPRFWEYTENGFVPVDLTNAALPSGGKLGGKTERGADPDDGICAWN